MKRLRPVRAAALVGVLLTLLALSCSDEDPPPVATPLPVVLSDPPVVVIVEHPNSVSSTPSFECVRWNVADDTDGPLWTRWTMIACEDESACEALLAFLSDNPDTQNWSDWDPYDPDEPGRPLAIGLDPGYYLLAVQAKDDEGNVTVGFDLDANARVVRQPQTAGGPLVSVANDVIGVIVSTSCETPTTIVDIPAGIPMPFCWAAELFSCCDEAYYRYGWDIEDLADPDQWAIAYTPFTSPPCSPARSFYFGTHTFTLEVIDCHNNCTRLEIKLNVIVFTMEKPVLLVDDYHFDEKPGAGWNAQFARGATPSDAEHDAFWDDMLSDVAGFDENVDVHDVAAGQSMPLTLFAQYKSVVWSASSNLSTTNDLPLLYEFIRHQREFPYRPGHHTTNILALYMQAGGHVLITGAHPMSNVINRDFLFSLPRVPFMFLYEIEGEQQNLRPDDTPGEKTFAYRDLCLDVLDYAIVALNRVRGNSEVCPVTTIRNTGADAPRVNGMRAGVPIDFSFPRIELRPETAGFNAFHHVDARGLDTEVYNPSYFSGNCPWAPFPRDCFEPIYGNECLDTMDPIYNQPVAFWTSVYADRVAVAPGAIAARSAVFGFPPVYFKPAQVKPAIEQILFGEWQLPRVP